MLSLAGCTDGGSSESSPPTAPAGSSVKANIEGSCQPLEAGSQITLTYNAEVEGSAPLTRVRLYVDGALTEDSGRVGGPSYRRNATVRVPDQTAHVFQVIAEAGGARSTASTTITCTVPTPGPTL